MSSSARREMNTPTLELKRRLEELVKQVTTRPQEGRLRVLRALEALEHVAAYFQVLSEPTRLQILNLLRGGERNVGDVADQLAAKYAAPREAILADVIVMLQDLADKGFLTEAREKTS